MIPTADQGQLTSSDASCISPCSSHPGLLTSAGKANQYWYTYFFRSAKVTRRNWCRSGSAPSKDANMRSVTWSNKAFFSSVDLNCSIVLKFLKMPWTGCDPGGGLPCQLSTICWMFKLEG